MHRQLLEGREAASNVITVYKPQHKNFILIHIHMFEVCKTWFRYYGCIYCIGYTARVKITEMHTHFIAHCKVRSTVFAQQPTERAILTAAGLLCVP
jgi:hypothetical protein